MSLTKIIIGWALAAVCVTASIWAVFHLVVDAIKSVKKIIKQGWE